MAFWSWLIPTCGVDRRVREELEVESDDETTFLLPQHVRRRRQAVAVLAW